MTYRPFPDQPFEANSLQRKELAICPEEDSNFHALGALVPETSVSTNSTIWAMSLHILVLNSVPYYFLTSP